MDRLLLCPPCLTYQLADIHNLPTCNLKGVCPLPLRWAGVLVEGCQNNAITMYSTLFQMAFIGHLCFILFYR